MTDTTLRLTLDGDVATVTLSRPAKHNALDDTLIGNLAQAFQKLSVAEVVRVVVLAADGPSFCAGADIAGLGQSAGRSADDNRRDAMQVAVMLDAIDRCAKPVVAVIDGPALGGGVGLAAAADIVVASERASFALPEVRLGLGPDVLGPYVAAAIGTRACRRWFLTGERFDAREAHRLGLVHVLAPAERLAEAQAGMVAALRQGAPKAQAETKEFLRVIADLPAGPDRMRWTVGRMAEQRTGAEAQEGLAAFLEKRKPAWGA
jgi:methylglutaconyl-CoA hydratase